MDSKVCVQTMVEGISTIGSWFIKLLLRLELSNICIYISSSIKDIYLYDIQIKYNEYMCMCVYLYIYTAKGNKRRRKGSGFDEQLEL
jgi:hypothetical protein